MICFLDGLLAEKEPTRIVVNVNGVGYEVFIPISTYDRLPGLESSCRILTYDYVREDAHVLYGFSSEAERQMFLLLMNVNGIGPKLAMTAISGLSIRDLKAAIIQGDTKLLGTVSGIGKKTAERIVLELRDKFKSGEALEAIAGLSEASSTDLRLRDAILALISLGYNQVEAHRMIQRVTPKLKPEASVEEIVRKALAG